jgi:endonuclease YncB( thermonuclease family)
MKTAKIVMASASAGAILCLSLVQGAPQEPRAKAETKTQVVREQKPQPRPHGQPVAVDPAAITVDDGDTVSIRWGADDVEIIRILGIDTPETRHDEHSIPLDQPFGREARAFARGAFAVATDVKLVRADKLDPYDRTLGYLILDDKNYSVLVIRARLAEESVSHYGDNGLPELAAQVTAAAKSSGPLAFEPPHVFRKRMRVLSDWTKGSPREPGQ